MTKRLPVKPKPKLVDILPVSIDVLVFGWNNREFVNIETGNIEKAEAWTFLNGSANLNSAIKTGVRGKDGKKIFGYAAMADRLSALGVPITEEECKELVGQAVSQQMAFAKLMRKSDWTTSPELYDGKNSWHLISGDVKGISDKMNALLNKALKEAGSPLRLKGALKYKLVE